jgi:uncharacterized protein
VKDPLEALKVGDVLEFRIIGLDKERRRISLSRKSEASRQQSAVKPHDGKKPEKQEAVHAAGRKPAAGNSAAPHKLRPVAVKSSPAPRIKPDDDGTMYNPFVEAFKKMEKKK